VDFPRTTESLTGNLNATSSGRRALPGACASFIGRFLHSAAACLLVVLFSPLLHAQPKTAVTPAQWQATTLSKVGDWVDWPTNVLGKADQKFVIGILGPDPFKGDLGRLTKDTRVRNREVEIRYFGEGDPVVKCHMLFVPTASTGRFKTLASTLATNAVLTVGETDDFTKAGGVMCLQYEKIVPKERMVFNVTNGAKAGLSPQGRLMKILTAEK